MCLLQLQGVLHERDKLGLTAVEHQEHLRLDEADLSCIPRSVVRAVNGHSDGSDIDDNTYTARATLVSIKKALDTMDKAYLQFRPYRPEKYAKAICAGVAREKHDERLKKEGKSLNRRAGR